LNIEGLQQPFFNTTVVQQGYKGCNVDGVDRVWNSNKMFFAPKEKVFKLRNRRASSLLQGTDSRSTCRCPNWQGHREEQEQQ